MSTRRRPAPPAHAEPTSSASSPAPTASALDQYRQQAADIARALNEGGLPSLLPVEMDRKGTRTASSPVAGSTSAFSSQVETQGSMAARLHTPTARARAPTPPPPPASASSAGPSSSSSRAAAAMLFDETDDDIERETDAIKLKHLLLDARQRRRRDKEIIDHQQVTIRELALKLNDVSEFIDVQEDLEDRLRGMKQQHVQQMNDQKEAARVARLEMLESRVKLRSIEEELKRAHEADVTARANDLLDTRTAQVNEENFELIADRVMLSKDAATSKAKGTALAEQNTRLRREADLRASTEKELLLRSTKQKKEIVDLKRQVKAMEDNLDRVAAEYEAQLAAQKTAFEKQLKTVTAERDAAQHDALRLHADLSKLRQLSAQMMRQRSELEGFFHAALADVKREVVAERRQRVCQGASSASATHTNASALRIEGQPRLMLTDDTGRERRQWTVDKRGFPLLVDPAKVSGKALPPIPASGTQSMNPRLATSASRDSVPWEWDGAVDDVADDGAPLFHDETTVGATALRAIPDAPTLRELKSVKMEELSWRDKERVLQYLFRRLQRSRPGATRTVPTVGDASEVETTVRPLEQDDGIPDDSDTFLTQ